MNRPTAERVEEIRAIIADCAWESLDSHDRRLAELLAEIDALREQYGSFAWRSICAERDALAAPQLPRMPNETFYELLHEGMEDILHTESHVAAKQFAT